VKALCLFKTFRTCHPATVSHPSRSETSDTYYLLILLLFYPFQEPHVNTCYKHFYYFVCEFDLVSSRELEPLKEMTSHVCRDGSDPVATSSWPSTWRCQVWRHGTTILFHGRIYHNIFASSSIESVIFNYFIME
jgi:hypothetical protein